jgi:hypothetical protein
MIGSRTWWKASVLNYVADEPLLVSLVKYVQAKDRHRTPPGDGNLISSKSVSGLQMPVIDLDGPHLYLPSSTSGHAHLYLNVEIPRWRWWVLMWGLYMGKVIDLGYFVWSLRRGANFVRAPGVAKTEAERKRQETPAKFGWVFPVKDGDPR